MKQHVSAIVGGAIGLVLLVVVAGFAIFLPKVEAGSDEGASSTSVPQLPSRLGSLVALDSKNLPATLTQQISDVSQVTTVQRQAAKGLGKIYGVPAAYGFYASADAKSLAVVTVLDHEAGLFSPDGPPVVASAGQQPTYQLSRVRGAVCAQYFSQATTASGQAGGAAQLSRAHCQIGAHGRTYDIDARGLTLARTVAALKELAAA